MQTDQQQNISIVMTVSGLINGMIGGTILVLPLIGLASGYLYAISLNILVGFISFYTAKLIVVHLGKSKNMQQSILAHFDQKYIYLTAYAFIIWCGQIPVLIMYFKLVFLQLEGIFGQHQWIIPVLTIFLLIQTFFILNYNMGEQTMGIGIVSIIAYILFIAWALLTAPSGEKEVPAMGSPYLMVTTLFMAYSIHDIVSQNILKHQNKENYAIIIVATFVIGTIIYIFIGLGSVSIANRTSFKKNPETVEDYFEMGSPPVTIIEILYAFHIITVYPQFLKVSKVRFFNILNIQLKSRVEWKETTYIVIVIGLCYVCCIANLSIDTLIAVNGGIIGILVVIIIPVIIHLKCIYFDQKCGQIEGQQNILIIENQCECQYVYQCKATKIIEVVFLILMVIFSVFITVATLKDQLNKS